jgi:hypothetical protein
MVIGNGARPVTAEQRITSVLEIDFQKEGLS